MADVADKFTENVDGSYYVDEQCIACELCPDEAPENFQMTDGGDHAYVAKQPKDDDEKTACEEALESCPVDAIGNDG